MDAAIVAKQQDAGRAGHESQRMLVNVHRTRAAGIGISAGGVSPQEVRVLPEPSFERVEENTVGVVRINGDALVVPVLRIVAGSAQAIQE